jgi:23S rRNA (uridine2552-2'-O)-methyltransferase
MWRREQHRERFFRKARAEGYRARSAYKLIELADRFHLLRAGMVVLDLGAAPGSWSQVAAARVGSNGRVVAVDLQPIAPIPGVRVITGDVRAPATVAEILAALGQPADLVLSDMAPAATGILVVDQARAIELARAALAVAERALRPGGALVVKVFRGEELDRFLGAVRARFARVSVAVPTATRPESREAYVVARDFQGPPPEHAADA